MIEGKTAHELIKKTIAQVIVHGSKTTVYGGTIPAKIGDPNSPNDFDRVMIENEPMVLVLTNPLSRWCDISSHWVGITLRETEDSLQGYNPGHVVKYSKLYPVWLEKHTMGDTFNYTYGERFLHYPSVRSSVEFNQFKNCIELLKKHPTTRKACMSTWYPPMDVGHPYIPCNVFFQLRVIDGKLQWTTVVRSLDVLRGLTENIFMFTIWMEYSAMLLNCKLGDYTTIVLNPHIYQEQLDKGEHLIKVADSYDSYNPKQAFVEPFPSEVFKKVDYQLFDRHRPTEAVRLCAQLPYYWKNWKFALIAEWERLHKQYDLAEKIAGQVTNEFGWGIRQRLNKVKK